MISKELTKEILFEQRKKLIAKDFGVEREQLHKVKSKLDLPHILVISGIRRCGKSTLLKQVVDRFFSNSNFYYINFDDERWLDFAAKDFNVIYECLYELFGEARTFFIDEIQNVTAFETFVRRFYDDGFKFIITGSNSDLLHSELAVKLTGRYLEIPLLPFNFREFLSYKNIEVNATTFYDTVQRVAIREHFETFLFSGGMPEWIRFSDTDVLKQTYDNLITKDIAIRFKINHLTEMRQTYQYLITNFGRCFSYNSVAKQMMLEKNTVKNYIDYLELTFFAKQIYKFDHSYRKQIANEKKMYIVDNGFIPLISNALTNDKGRLLENCCFNQLLSFGEVFYFAQKAECDFVVIDKIQNTKQLYQITFEMNSFNRKREIEGLMEAMQFFNQKNGFILTYDTEETLSINDFHIEIVPVWKWFCKLKT